MLATWWDTDKGQTAPQFQPGHDTADFKNILDGFGGNPRGSLTEFYFENSFGQFLVQVDVFGPFTSHRSRQDRCYYGGIDPPPTSPTTSTRSTTSLGVGGLGAAGMAVEAVPQADPTSTSRSTTTTATATSTSWASSTPAPTWRSPATRATRGRTRCRSRRSATSSRASSACRTSTAPRRHPDDRRRASSTASSRCPSSTEAGGELDIGVATHEMAHALGEPDYYASTARRRATATGTSCPAARTSGTRPARTRWFNPATRVFQGWVTADDRPRRPARTTSSQPRECRSRATRSAGRTRTSCSSRPRDQGRRRPTTTGTRGPTNDVYGLVQDGDQRLRRSRATTSST